VSSFTINLKPKIKKNGKIRWALYASLLSQSGTNPPNSNGEQLSGDCDSLIQILCSTVSGSTVTVSDPDVTKVTNYYLVAWAVNPTDNIQNITATLGDGCASCNEPPVINCPSQVNVSLYGNGNTVITGENLFLMHLILVIQML
jgi:hypothetical protein